MYELKTPLYDLHVAAGGKMVEFGGFLMPVRYSGDVAEHTAVREAAGLFDVSHMGEVLFSGPGSLEALQKLVTNDVSKLYPGKALYSPMCYANGTTVDDVLIYMLAEQSYLVVVNASNIEKDYAWMLEQVGPMTRMENASEQYGLLALQGPKARAIGARFFAGHNILGIKRFHAIEVDHPLGRLLVSRTGYTGEDGLEVYCPAEAVCDLWRGLLAAGAADGLIPCGLGARDSLRLEAALPLYGHELSDVITPFEAGLSWTVKFQKPAFNGRSALLKQQEEGLPREIVALVTTEKRAIPRSGYPVLLNGEEIGSISSGLFSPTLKQGIGLALVKSGKLQVGDTCSLSIRSNVFEAQVVQPPFVNKKY